MVSGRSLRDLFASYVDGDQAATREAAEAIIAEERAKNNRLLADDLEHILRAGGVRTGRRRRGLTPLELPKDRESGIALIDVSEPDNDWDRVVLAPQTLDKLVRIADENHRRDVLAVAGLRPTQRVLFYGPPGCGKSITAAVLAGVLSRPLVTVRLDALVSSYLGETSSNLRRVFEFIQTAAFVVLFDEFDAIGKDRDNHFEHGELKRLVNSLLQLMDAYRGDSMLIAATNHQRLLDNAVWRRFESVVKFSAPTYAERIRLLRLYLRAFDTSEICMRETAKKLQGMTGGDIELAAVDAARRAVLDGRRIVRSDDMEPALLNVSERMVVSGAARINRGSNKDSAELDENWDQAP